uniref:Uncharacterized protein n=1 Tax=Romanomermis culicivorax TaxID=13658 RepID=A0A915JD35_ROMCU
MLNKLLTNCVNSSATLFKALKSKLDDIFFEESSKNVSFFGESGLINNVEGDVRSASLLRPLTLIGEVTIGEAIFFGLGGTGGAPAAVFGLEESGVLGIEFRVVWRLRRSKSSNIALAEVNFDLLSKKFKSAPTSSVKSNEDVMIDWLQVVSTVRPRLSVDLLLKMHDVDDIFRRNLEASDDVTTLFWTNLPTKISLLRPLLFFSRPLSSKRVANLWTTLIVVSLPFLLSEKSEAGE